VIREGERGTWGKRRLGFFFFKMPCRSEICQVGKKLDISWTFVLPLTFSFFYS
jgi:hypothetical protein